MMKIFNGKIGFSLLALSMFPLSHIGAQEAKPPKEATEKVMLYFKINEASVDPGYMTNAAKLDLLDSLFANNVLMNHLDSLSITAFASPEGNPAYNARLATERAQAVRQYIIGKHPFVSNYIMHTKSIGENWKGLQAMVEADKQVPARKQVLQILAQESSPVLREYKLRQLDNGVPWRYMERYLMKYLRGSAFVLFYVDASAPDELNMPGVIIHKEAVQPAPEKPDTVPQTIVTPAPDVRPRQAAETYRLVRPLALKTNLLFDAVTALNFEVEVPVAKRFSIAGEWIFPWWLWEDKQNCFEVLSGNLEARYWFRPNFAKQDPSLGLHNPLTGWFVGLYGGGGKYDLEKNREGYQGEFFIATGVSGGYVLPLNRNISMEFSLGLGIMRTKYRHYHAEFCEKHDEWHLKRQNSGLYTWIGPTRAKISFIWYPHIRLNKKGGTR